ncbi:helix-turn-helix transcriptional regulator [Qaidamihabitans albus]|uniref:helix-turn-helix transcriptional regulator n=1 Tax=Qaidamihabitans albus TaxID=2795733 RepID=UPI001F46F42D|nr:helix-turn-helix transcriptional regulator [Qaidamihabitans albus]
MTMSYDEARSARNGQKRPPAGSPWPAPRSSVEDRSPTDGGKPSSEHDEVEPIWTLVRRARRQRGLTQYELADVLVNLSRNRGLSRHEVARWERGKRVPGPYWQRWLSAALGVPAEQLLAAARRGRRLR